MYPIQVRSFAPLPCASSLRDRSLIVSVCVPLDPGLLCDLLWSDPDKDITGWSENDRGVSFTFGPDVVSRFLQKHDMDLICRAHQVVEDGYEFFAKRQLVTLFSAPVCHPSPLSSLLLQLTLLTCSVPLHRSIDLQNYCGEFDNSGAMMSVDATLLCSFQVSPPFSIHCALMKQE